MPGWVRRVVSGNLFAPRAGDADLRAAGFDFDDLGCPAPRERPASTALLIMAHPAYGLGVLHGAIIGGVATMIWLEPGMAYGRGYR